MRAQAHSLGRRLGLCAYVFFHLCPAGYFLVLQRREGSGTQFLVIRFLFITAACLTAAFAAFIIEAFDGDLGLRPFEAEHFSARTVLAGDNPSVSTACDMVEHWRQDLIDAPVLGHFFYWGSGEDWNVSGRGGMTHLELISPALGLAPRFSL